MNNASICTTRTASAWKVTNYGNGRVGTCVWWLNEWPQHVLCRIFVGMGLHRSSSVRHGWSRVCHQHIVLSKWRHKNLRRNYSGFEPICHICSFTPFLSLLSLIAIDPSSPPPSLLSQLSQYHCRFCSVSSVGLLHSRTRTWHCLHKCNQDTQATKKST